MSVAAITDEWTQEWASQARCSSQDPDALFVRGKAQHDAKAVCKTCPVLAQCLAEALDNRTEFGVWGGMTERERRAILRKRPNVTSWRTLLETAMTEHAGITEAVEA
jgi:WhiB family redox-sensing transcriptional regulator